MIKIKDLAKQYAGGVEALKGISLSVKPGEFYGLLGPNGAGKSTTIGILSSLVMKDSGQVTIDNHNIDTNPQEAKACLGIVPQEFNFNIFEQCLQIVVNQAGYYGIPREIATKRAEDLFKQLGLWEKRFVSARALSGGMKRRLMIARALVNNPKVLILDEPTAGVDIQLRRSMYTFLEKQNKAGLTIILTTHYLEEAESLCDRIGIIDQGQLIENDRTETIINKLKVETFILYCTPIHTLPRIDTVKLTQLDETTLEVDLCQSCTISELIALLSEHNIHVNRLRNKANRLEEIFLKLVSTNDA
ncbi:ABC transporter [Candidatus Marinamargulisbacteria bacterium SCGC AG-439-L15]|nr:ABC transporter [Candidatus Marinamargulisbacteria bacterium SCGC AG-439-L15]